ncbi:MAG: hypothetical protein ACR2OZ_14015 [Verrucomicrobiales bacterium]
MISGSLLNEERLSEYRWIAVEVAQCASKSGATKAETEKSAFMRYYKRTNLKRRAVTAEGVSGFGARIVLDNRFIDADTSQS